jgi:hypothetical protein
MDPEVVRLLALQAGVVRRAQLLGTGLAPHDVRRLVRRRELTPVHPGVLVDHTGPLTWQQRAWAAVLHAWPAVLCHDSAVRAYDGPGRRGRDDDGPLHIAVDRTRSFTSAVPGVVTHHLADLDAKALWNLGPPRVRIEEALVDVAAEASDEFRAIASLADAVQARRTTADRLAAALAGRSRIARRAFLDAVLTDIAAGTCSVLEHGYLTRVERPHGLPRAGRQVRASSRGPVYRDVVYHQQRHVVELDGRAFHDSAGSRDADLDRDLVAAVGGHSTSRIGWGQVFARGCRTAWLLGRVLQARGWTAAPLPCPRCTPDDLALGTGQPRSGAAS